MRKDLFLLPAALCLLPACPELAEGLPLPTAGCFSQLSLVLCSVTSYKINLNVGSTPLKRDFCKNGPTSDDLCKERF
jgi:hypothetical protein